MIFHLFASASVRYFVTLIFCLLIVALHYIVFKVHSFAATLLSHKALLHARA